LPLAEVVVVQKGRLMRGVRTGEIMIVEDDGGLREALTEVLEGEGYTVRGLANGREAITDLRARPSVPSLIIVDLLMPLMNGHEFCTALLLDPELAGIPVVLMSADAHLGERAGDVEAAAYLKKPLDVQKLLATIQEHCPA
jgi:CheY-like chemotaxis protein